MRQLSLIPVLCIVLHGCGDSGSDPDGAGASTGQSAGGGEDPSGAGATGGSTTGAGGSGGLGPELTDRCQPEAAPEPPPPLRTLYVDGDAGDDSLDGTSMASAFKTLTHANAVAQPGDLFLVKGTFVDQNIRPAVDGTERNMIVYRVMEGQTASIQQGTYSTAVRLTGVQYVVVDGFELTDNDDPASLGSHDWLRNCHIHDNTGHIRIIGANDTRVEDNEIPDCGTYCFWMSDGSTGNQVLRNTIGTSTSVAFMLSSPGNTIGYNDFANSLEANLFATEGADQTLIECNTFRLAGTQAESGYYTPSVRIGSNDNVIRYNLVHDNALEGISFWMNANGNAMYHNVVWGNGGPDLRLLISVDYGTIEDNTFVNNVFWNNNHSDDSHWNHEGTKAKVVVDTYHVGENGWTDGSFGGNVIANNLIGADVAEIGKGWLLMIGYTKNSVYTLSEAAAAWPDAIVDDLEADPLLTDPAAGLFDPRDDSPCIDKGAVIEGLEAPFQGAAPDLGRYERAASLP